MINPLNKSYRTLNSSKTKVMDTIKMAGTPRLAISIRRLSSMAIIPSLKISKKLTK